MASFFLLSVFYEGELPTPEADVLRLKKSKLAKNFKELIDQDEMDGTDLYVAFKKEDKLKEAYQAPVTGSRYPRGL